MRRGRARARTGAQKALVSEGTGSRDRRTGGEWTRLQTAKNWLIACGVRAAFAVSDRMPEAALFALGRALGRAVRAASRGALRRAREHSARCLPSEEANRVAFLSFERAGENLATSLLLRRKSVKALDWVDVPERARGTLVEALSEERGAVFVSAHLGPFELLAAAIAELGLRPAIVVRESYDARLDAWIDRHRHARGIDVIHRGAPGAATRIVRALRAGQPLGFLPDLGGRVPKALTHFLGRRAGFPVGPQQIAQRLRAPIVVGALRPIGPGLVPSSRRFALSVERVDGGGSLLEITQRVALVLERAILCAPEDFPWMASSLSRSAVESRIAGGREKELDLPPVLSL